MARKTYDGAGRTAFVTGAARGIGLGIAQRLHARGANVALVGLEPELLEARAAELGDRAAWFEADVTDLDALRLAAAGTAQRFGGIDVAVANAGLSFVGAVESQPAEQWQRTIDVNLVGVFKTDQAVLPYLRERRGYVANVASLSAIAHAPLMSAYTASKAGCEALTDALRQELAGTGTTAGCVYFGFIDTDLVRNGFEHPASAVITRSQPRSIRTPVPLSVAVDTLEDAIARRRARAWAPRFVGPMLFLRGITQPLVELAARREHRTIAEAVRLAHPEHAAAPPVDPELGVGSPT